METWGDSLAFTTGLGPGGIALLHMARKLRRVHCIFLDTGFHFPATLQYAEDIAALLDVDIEPMHPEPFGPTFSHKGRREETGNFEFLASSPFPRL